MTNPNVIEPVDFIQNVIEQNQPDVMRHMLQSFINTLMSAEASVLCGAGYREVSPERTNARNGYRDRQLDTRVETLELRIPKLRNDSYFPDWLLDARKRSEQALRQVVALPARLTIAAFTPCK